MRLNENIENDIFSHTHNTIWFLAIRMTEAERERENEISSKSIFSLQINGREKTERKQNRSFYLTSSKSMRNICSFGQIEKKTVSFPFHCITPKKSDLKRNSNGETKIMYATYMQQSNRFLRILHLRQDPIYTSLYRCCLVLRVRLKHHIRPHSAHGQSICTRDSCPILETIEFLVVHQVAQT